MKKQILFLAMFVAALLAGNMNSYAQVGAAKPYQTVPTAVPTCLTPTPFTNPALCLTDELHPVQGTTYDYIVTTTAATDIVRWFVVDNTAMEAAGDSLVRALSGILPAANGAIDLGDGTDPYLLNVISGTYNGTGAAASTNATIQLQWKFFDGVTNEVLLVAYVEGADGCTNNIAAYRIIPKPAFTIDIASVTEGGLLPAGPSDTPNEECVSPIEMAWYNGQATTPADMLTVDYGENWAFFVVNGANYIDSWLPEFNISYTGGTVPPGAEASWAYLNDATSTAVANWNTLTGAIGGTWTSAVPVIAGASAASPGAVGAGVVPDPDGECIVVRVRLDWGTLIEHDDANGILNVAVNGVAYDGVGTGLALFDDDTNFEDLHHVDCVTDGFTNDEVDYLITPRPKVEEVTPVQEDKTGEGVN